MAYPSISQRIDHFVRAAEAGQLESWLGSLPVGTSVYRNGSSESLQAARQWARDELTAASSNVRLLGRRSHLGQLTFIVRSKGEAGQSNVSSTSWRLRISEESIERIDIRTNDPTNLPAPAARFVEAVNREDEESILALFGNDAVVNDELVEHRGKDQIEQWVRTSILRSRMGLEVVDSHAQDGSVSLHVEAWGEFGPGLPEPLALTLYFSVAAGQIAQLIVMQRALPD
jgi:hypothetical protein